MDILPLPCLYVAMFVAYTFILMCNKLLIRPLFFFFCRQLECVLCIPCTSVHSKYCMQSSGQMEKFTPRSMELFVTHDHTAKEQADSQLTWLQLEEHPAWLSRGTHSRGSCTL